MKLNHIYSKELSRVDNFNVEDMEYGINDASDVGTSKHVFVTGTITNNNEDREFFQSFVLVPRDEKGNLCIASSFFKFVDSVTWSGKKDAVTSQKSSDEVEKSTAEEMIYEHQVSCTNVMPETSTTTATMESLDASIVQIGAIVIDEVSLK